METEQATTVQPATDDMLIQLECQMVALFLSREDYANAARSQERLEYWVLRKHGAR